MLCTCKHPKLYHMSSSIQNIRTRKVMPIEFCLECDCTKFVEEKQSRRQSVCQHICINQLKVRWRCTSNNKKDYFWQCVIQILIESYLIHLERLITQLQPDYEQYSRARTRTPFVDQLEQADFVLVNVITSFESIFVLMRPKKETSNPMKRHLLATCYGVVTATYLFYI